MLRLVIKNKKNIQDYFTSTQSDLNDEVNRFYLSISSKVVTIDGFCEKDNVFICKEYPEYVIPMEFISHIYKNSKISNNISENSTFEEIANTIGITPEGARKLTLRAVNKIQKIIFKSNFYKEYFNA